MYAKEYLKQYENAVRRAQRLQKEYEDELEQIDNIRSSLGGDGLPRSGEISKKVERQALKLSEKAEELKGAEVEAIAIRNEIFRTVMRVPDDMGSVLYERYILLKKWDDISDSVGYTVRHIHNIHREGLEYIEKILN